MNKKVTCTSIIFSLLAIVGITAADTTEATESIHSDTLEALNTITHTNHCESPYNTDYVEALEEHDDEVRFAGCGGLL